MLKYIFILGKNWLLSLSEINHILKRNEYRGKIIDYSACAAIIEFEQDELPEEKIAQLIFQLGGTLKICKIVDFIDYEIFERAFPEQIDGSRHPGLMIDARKHVEGTLKDIVFSIFGRIEKKNESNFFVANSIYPIEFNSKYYKTLIKHFLHFVNKTWVSNLKEKGAKKASYYRYPEENVKSGNLNPIFPHHFMRYELYKLKRKEIVYTLTEEGLYIGYTLNVTNSNEMKMIDEERPYKNPKGSIPPKFAKIMINLLNLQRPYSTRRILDPFVGSGTIILFAYILGIQIFGSDEDKKSIDGVKKNIKWIQNYLEKPLKMNLEKNIITSDITDIEKKFNGIKFDGIVTEPILLPYFKALPRYDSMKDLTQNYVIPTYKKSFKIFKKILKPKARVVITSPSIETLDGGRIRVNLNEINKQFKTINVLNQEDISEKSDKNLKLRSKRNVIFDGKSKYFRREFYIFEN